MLPPHISDHRRVDPHRGLPAMTSQGRLGLLARAALLVLALALVAVLATAAALRPDPAGFGTHRQLGLPPCGFLAMTGRPCPSCGMTTAFAWAVRGRFDLAWQANPVGSVLAPSAAALVPWLAVCGVSGRPRWGARSIDGPLIAVLVATVGLSLAAWLLRLLIQGRI